MKKVAEEVEEEAEEVSEAKVVEVEQTKTCCYRLHRTNCGGGVVVAAGCSSSSNSNNTDQDWRPD